MIFKLLVIHVFLPFIQYKMGVHACNVSNIPSALSFRLRLGNLRQNSQDGSSRPDKKSN
jgi:hypothetical protein